MTPNDGATLFDIVGMLSDRLRNNSVLKPMTGLLTKKGKVI